jgi:aryl-alcohol dehydrogenase-like predicted oxidoreductase
MDYRRLGNSGLRVSVVGLGANNFGRRCDREQTAVVVRRALELGITCIDTADIYGPAGLSEEYLGAALKGHRRDVVLATKFGGPMGDGPNSSGASRGYVLQAVHASLRRLETDYIDLYQIHFPDAETPIDETMRALDDLVRSGEVRYIGCSNFNAAQIVEAQWTARASQLTPFVSAQNRYNLLERGVEESILPICTKYGLGMLPYVPLAGGFLTGKYRQGEAAPPGTRLSEARQAERTLTDSNYARLQQLEAHAERYDHTILELAIAWLAAQPAVASVIAGATRPEQLEANVRAAEWHMTAEEAAEVKLESDAPVSHARQR